MSELAASVSVHLDRAVRQVLDPDTVATLARVPVAATTTDPTTAWRHTLTRKQAELDELNMEAKGHRAQAARAASLGRHAEADAYADDAAEVATRARAVTEEITRLNEKLRETTDIQATSRDENGDISVAAYLVVGLERAARNNGTGPARLGQLCDQVLVDWRFHPRDEDLAWTCHALIPLAAGGHARLSLDGTIRNVRTRTGKSLANTATVIRYLFEEGRDLTDVADLLEVSRKGLLTRRVMPWMVSQGITARGAKCALVDHPLPAVRSAVYRHLQTTPAEPSPTNGYQHRLYSTYLDPDLSWGDAAVPDDTTWVQQALGLVTADTMTKKHGLPILDVALALGRTEAEVRELVKPQRRPAGFTRPRYLVYADKARTKVKAIGCPHDRCRGRRFADHVVLLPEVGASGYGVICRNCRRVPALQDDWNRVQFPLAYLNRWTNSGPGGSLRQEAQTVPAP